MTDLEKACHHILWIWYQYGKSYETDDGVLHLEHQCMQAGERACDFLQKHGYAEDEGWTARVTPAGEKLMEWDAAAEGP